jgi:hypothetical protein
MRAQRELKELKASMKRLDVTEEGMVRRERPMAVEPKYSPEAGRKDQVLDSVLDSRLSLRRITCFEI